MSDSISAKNEEVSKNNQSEHIFHVMPPATGGLSKDVPTITSKEVI